jgi:uncharacterized protein YdeI (BOF family)
MKKTLLTLTVLLGATGAFAQSDSAISVSTDQARAAAVLNHAQQLQAQPADKTTVAQSPSAKTHKHKAYQHHGKRHVKKS